MNVDRKEVGTVVSRILFDDHELYPYSTSPTQCGGRPIDRNLSLLLWDTRFPRSVVSLVLQGHLAFPRGSAALRQTGELCHMQCHTANSAASLVRICGRCAWNRCKPVMFWKAKSTVTNSSLTDYNSMLHRLKIAISSVEDSVTCICFVPR
jgi:hypothetical protein